MVLTDREMEYFFFGVDFSPFQFGYGLYRFDICQHYVYLVEMYLRIIADDFMSVRHRVPEAITTEIATLTVLGHLLIRFAFFTDSFKSLHFCQTQK